MEDQFHPSLSTFSEAKESLNFVDTTPLIRSIFQHKGKIFITAPPRFGKTTNMDMVRRFVEFEMDGMGGPVTPVKATNNYQLFTSRNFKIMDDRNMVNLLGKNLTLFVSCKPEKDQEIDSLEDMVNACRDIVHTAYHTYRFLMNSTVLDGVKGKIAKWLDRRKYKDLDASAIQSGLTLLYTALQRNLREHLQENLQDSYKNVLILVDDYDYLIMKALASESNNDVTRCVDYFASILPRLEETDSEIATFVCSGTYRCQLTDENPEVHHFEFLTNEEFTQYYGLTSDTARIFRERVSTDDTDAQRLRSLYGGYKSRTNLHEMYNSWSLLNALRDYVKERGSGSSKIFPARLYWKQPENREVLLKLLDNLRLKLQLEQLATGQKEFILGTVPSTSLVTAIRTLSEAGDPVDLVSFFVQIGYLSYHIDPANPRGRRPPSERSDPGKDVYRFCIANDETKRELKDFLISHYAKRYNFSEYRMDRCGSLIDNITNDPEGNFLDFRMEIENLLVRESDIPLQESISVLPTVLALNQKICKIHMSEGEVVFEHDRAVLIMRASRERCDLTLQEMIDEKKWRRYYRRSVENVILMALRITELDNRMSVSLGTVLSNTDELSLSSARYFN